MIDVHRGGYRWAGITGALGMVLGVGHVLHLMPGGILVPSGSRRPLAQIVAAIRQTSAGELETWIAAQTIEIVGILIAAGDGEHSRASPAADCVCPRSVLPADARSRYAARPQPEAAHRHRT